MREFVLNIGLKTSPHMTRGGVMEDLKVGNVLSILPVFNLDFDSAKVYDLKPTISKPLKAAFSRPFGQKRLDAFWPEKDKPHDSGQKTDV